MTTTATSNGQTAPAGFVPPTFLMFGPEGVGKSTAVLRALVRPDLVDWVEAERGATLPFARGDLNPHRNGAGGVYVPRTVPIWQSMHDPYAALGAYVYQDALPRIQAGQLAVVVIDTLSAWVAAEKAKVTDVEKITEKFGHAARTVVTRLRQCVWPLLRSGVCLVAICHEAEPFKYEDKNTKGGVSMPDSIRKELSGAFDVVFRMHDAPMPGYSGVQRVLSCRHLDPDWRMKDRCGVFNNQMIHADHLGWVVQQCIANAKALATARG